MTKLFYLESLIHLRKNKNGINLPAKNHLQVTTGHAVQISTTNNTISFIESAFGQFVTWHCYARVLAIVQAPTDGIIAQAN
jgi:hypothetical protein